MVIAQEPARLFVLTCNENEHGQLLPQPLDEFAVYEFETRRPDVLIFGYKESVSSADRKFLKKLNRGKSPEEVRAALGRVNARSAKRSNGTVSSGCLVTSILAGGHAEFQNFGGTPGTPSSLPEVKNLLDEILPGQQPVFVQGREVRSSGTSTMTTNPMNVTEGNTLIVTVKADKPTLFLTDASGNTFTHASASRGWNISPEEEESEYESTHRDKPIGPLNSIELIPGTALGSIMTATGMALGEIKIHGSAKQLTLKKNRIAVEVLNTISVQLDPGVEYKGPSHKMLGVIKCIPTIGGVRPRDWSYTLEVSIDETEGCTITLRKMSLAFRSANYPGGMKLLSGLEELVLAAPRRKVELKVSRTAPAGTADIEARFLLRDFAG